MAGKGIQITNLGNTKKYLNNSVGKVIDNFDGEFIRQTKALSVHLQQGMNNAIDKGAVSFTQRAVLYFYNKHSDGSITATIKIKELQAKYLYDVIVQPDIIEKFVPTSSARLTAQGNIPRLKSNIDSGRYKVVKSGGKERLIDTSKKAKTEAGRRKRVIGVRENKKRKIVYDFYKNAEIGVEKIIATMHGTYRFTRGI
ncbi:hypothetical protein ACSPON_000279 [Klebsiella aerogenes]